MKTVPILSLLLTLLLDSLNGLGANVAFTPPVAQTFGFAERYNKPIRVGDFPVFRINLGGRDSGGLRAFLKHDGTVIGEVFRAAPVHFKSDTVTMEWRLTRYVTRDRAIHLAEPGEGYAIFVGILRNKWAAINESAFATDAFAVTDETPLFTLTPSPLAVLHHYGEQIDTTTGDMDELTLYVLGPVGRPYIVLSSEVMPPRWVKAVEFTSAEEIVELSIQPRESAVAKKVFRQQGFFAVVPIPLGEISSPVPLGKPAAPFRITIRGGSASPHLSTSVMDR